jgi:hypothetical protein
MPAPHDIGSLPKERTKATIVASTSPIRYKWPLPCLPCLPCFFSFFVACPKIHDANIPLASLAMSRCWPGVGSSHQGRSSSACLTGITSHDLELGTPALVPTCSKPCFSEWKAQVDVDLGRSSVSLFFFVAFCVLGVVRCMPDDWSWFGVVIIPEGKHANPV